MRVMPGRRLTNMANQTQRSLNSERAGCLTEDACYSSDKNRQRKVIVWLRASYMLFSSDRSSVKTQVWLEESSKSRHENNMS